jgi:hypothetical protein
MWLVQEIIIRGRSCDIVVLVFIVQHKFEKESTDFTDWLSHPGVLAFQILLLKSIAMNHSIRNAKTILDIRN